MMKSCEAERTFVKLEELPFIRAIGGVRLSLECRESIRVGEVTRDHNNSNDTPHFAWRCTLQDLDDAIYFLEGMLNCSTPCHQYLSGYIGSDATLVVSIGEYTDDIFES